MICCILQSFWLLRANVIFILIVCTISIPTSFNRTPKLMSLRRHERTRVLFNIIHATANAIIFEGNQNIYLSVKTDCTICKVINMSLWYIKQSGRFVWQWLKCPAHNPFRSMIKQANIVSLRRTKIAGCKATNKMTKNWALFHRPMVIILTKRPQNRANNRSGYNKRDYMCA